MAKQLPIVDRLPSTWTQEVLGSVCCRCCRFRRHKRGMLASTVLVPRRWLRVWFDFGASVGIVWELMAVPDTALALASAFASVFIFETYLTETAVNLNWTAVGFMLAFPLQHAISEAYRRREVALQALVEFRATTFNVYLANAVWDWPGAETYNGRAEDNIPAEAGGGGMKKKPCNIPLSSQHKDRVRKLLFRILDAVQEVLLVPRAGHARMDYFFGREEKRQLTEAQRMGRDAILQLLARLHGAVEDMKAAGMPANEASRINQYNQFLVRDFERLWAAKTYHTPIALRALLRVVIQLLPFFYGPYWLYVARGISGHNTTASMIFALAFCSLISLLLIAMVNLEEQMENPFRHSGASNRDSIRVKDEIELARREISAAEVDLNTPWYEDVRFPWEGFGRNSDYVENQSVSSTSRDGADAP